MEMLALAGRVIVSLAVVLVLLWLAARGLRKNQRRTMRGIAVDVLARQPLAQRSSLAVVQVGDRALVLGVTESRVELLTEASLESLVTTTAPVESSLPAPPSQSSQPGSTSPAVVTSRPTASATGPLAGSALSPATWLKAVDAVREKTVRR